ncbi:MAG: hypothetical protein IJH11_08175 [Lachnospiraceae bacterium]|nr:hypothetical protein [Lachnospiraceae bacterium]
METEKKELIGYLRTFDIVLFCMFIVFGVIGIVTVIVVGLPGVMFLIPACIALINWLGKYNEAAGLVRKMEKDCSLADVLYDFRNGERFLNGRLIRGENYIMSRGTGKVLRVTEVARLLDYRKKNGFAGDTRQLRAEMSDGKVHDLTFVSMKGRDEEDIRRLCYM